jgi:hypothetical protein
VIITIAKASVRLVDPSDFTRFSVAVTTGEEPGTDGGDDAVDDALAAAGAGRVVHAGQAAIDPLFIRRAAGDAAETAEWNKGFDAMLAYASSKNWITGNGEILAHIDAIAEPVD